MELNNTQRLILYALAQFYHSLNQPLLAKPLALRTSKIMFIELLLKSKLLPRQPRTVYKNLEFLEQKKLIKYEHHLILFTPKGLEHLDKINREIQQFMEMKEYFAMAEKPKRKLQTMISG